MAKKFREKLRKFNPFTRPMTLTHLRCRQIDKHYVIIHK